jgi:putative nucleotidyltransferase-like protein
VTGRFEGGGHAIWPAVDRLIDSTTDLDVLRANRIHLLAAQRWRDRGWQVPPELEAELRRGVLVSLLVPQVLMRLRAACDGPLVVHKGPEIARGYPDPSLRPFRDVDVLVPDAASVQEALLAAGFVEVGDRDFYMASPHEPPVEWPGLPLSVEIHDAPNWPRWIGRPPSTPELLDAAVPSALGVDGVHTLAWHHHAVVVAAHAWVHGPLAQARDLVDVAVLADGRDRDELRKLARRWAVDGLWQTTLEASDAVLFGAPRPRALKIWARNLPELRERTVLENHLARWLSGFSALGPRRGLRVLLNRVGSDLRPKRNESWANKLRRTRRALRNARVTKSEHDEGLEERVGRR